MGKVTALEATNNRNAMMRSFMLCAFMVLAFAAVAVASGTTGSVGFSGDTVSGASNFPWTKLLNTLAKELTGPLPLTLGILGLAAAAIAMFTGNGGGGTQKFIMLIFAVSTCLFAPTFIQWVSKSAGGATITDVAATAATVGSTLLP